MIVGIRRVVFRTGFNRVGEATVTEIMSRLHSTKGWRTSQIRKRKTKNRDLPVFSATFQRTAPVKERIEFKFKDEPAREKALMRHSWYRKQKMWEAFRASLPEENRV